MRKTVLLLLMLIFLCWFAMGVSAAEEVPTQEEIYEKSGAQELYEILDDDTQSLLDDAGTEGAVFDLSKEGGNLFSAVSEALREKLTAPMRTAALLLAVIVLCKLCGSLDHGEIASLAGTVCMLAAAGILVPQLISLIGQTKTVVNGSAAFLVGSVPVYTALHIAVGNVQTAASTGYLTLAAGNAIPILASVVFIPLLNIFLALSITSAISKNGLEKLAEGMYRFVKWLLILSVTIFFALMSLQTAIQAGMDSATAKTAKMVVSSAIPVIGGTIGDSLGAIQGSVQIVKSGVGAFGILAALAIFLPVLLQALLWTGVCWIGEIVSELFEMQQIAKFLKAAGAAVRMVSAVLVSSLAVCLTCASILVVTRGSL